MIALNPNQKFQFTLDIQADQPEHTRTRFTSKFLSAAVMAEIDQLTDDASAKAGDEEKQILLQALELGCVQMEAKPALDRMAITFDIEAELTLEDRTKIVFSPLSGEALANAASTRNPIGTPSIRIAAYVAILEAAGAKVVRSGETIGWTSATLEELNELCGKICLLSTLAQAKDLNDLTSEALWEVLVAAMKHSRLTEIERKKSALQSASAAAARSAGFVRPARA